MGGAAGGGLPAAVQEGRHHRHAVLPATRAQRGRRPVDDEPGHVRRHRHQARRPQDLHRSPDRPRRHLDERSRGRAARLPGPTGAGVQRSPRPREARRAAERIGRVRPDDSGRGCHRGGQGAAGPHRRRLSWPCRRASPCIRGSSPVLERRREMAYEGKVDWAFGELLALGIAGGRRQDWCGCPGRTPGAARSPSGIR